MQENLINGKWIIKSVILWYSNKQMSNEFQYCLNSKFVNNKSNELHPRSPLNWAAEKNRATKKNGGDQTKTTKNESRMKRKEKIEFIEMMHSFYCFCCCCCWFNLHIALVWHVLAGEWCSWWKPMFIHIALLLPLYFICWTILFARNVFWIGWRRGDNRPDNKHNDRRNKKSMAKTKVWCYKKRQNEKSPTL